MPHYTPTAPRVSVLMAVHDAEKTVRRAVESLQSQTLHNFELIVVDVDSSDDTPRLLSSLAERDMRIHVTSVGDCARSEALNLALERSCGSYLLVMDADGWADQTMLEELVDLAEEGSLELAIGGYSLSVGVRGGRMSQVDVSAARKVFPTQQAFRADAWRLFASGQLLPASAKLFLRSAVEERGVRFPADSASDHSFVIDFLRDVERVGVLGGTCYHLSRHLGTSELQDADTMCFRMIDDEHTALLDLYRHWLLDGDAASMDMLQSRYMEQLAGYIEGICRPGSSVSAAEQRKRVASIIDTDRAQLAASVAHPQAPSARALQAAIRARNAVLTYVQTRLISILRRGAVAEMVPDIFL